MADSSTRGPRTNCSGCVQTAAISKLRWPGRSASRKARERSLSTQTGLLVLLQERPSQQCGLLLIGAPGRSFLPTQLIHGIEHSVERQAQTLPRVRLQLPGRYPANLQAALLRRRVQRISEMLAIRGMNQSMRCQNRPQRNLLAAGRIDDADRLHGDIAALQFLELGAKGCLRHADGDRHVSVQTAGGFLDA